MDRRRHLAVTRPLRGLFLPLLILATGSVLAGAAEPWGTDTNAGDGPKLIKATAPHLVRIVDASEAERPALIEAYANGPAAAQIEAVKRFRNPELHALFRALARHEDWKVRHRALYALEYYDDPEDLPLAFAALGHEEPRLREKAALTAIKLWDRKGARALEGDPEALVAARLDAERDPHVAAAVDALLLRMDGKLDVRRVHAEHLEKRADGLLIAPFLSGMNNVSQVAPSYRKQGDSRSGGSSAAKLPVGPFTTPIVRFGEEARSGMSLQPFANLRGGGSTYHTGLDVGACLDGAGFYALAPGVVKFVHTGSDMGTLIVVQHPLGDKRTVNAVYMHGGDTVFVDAGDRVETGQLLTTMGMGYGIENGGHYAHLHFGLYPGDFSTTHNYGYRAVSAGLVDWYDPAHYVPLWVDLYRPLISPLHSRAALGKTVDLLRDGKYGAAYDKAEDHGETGAALRVELKEAVGGAVARAEAIRDRGYPERALAFLEETARAAKGIPGADAVSDAAKAWKKDEDLKRAIKGEKKLHDVEREAMDLVGRPDEARALWAELLEAYADTCLEGRIRHRLESVGG
jgi:murein DD-endopeptidase MepM/ murein hydrolase activator NlpD